MKKTLLASTFLLSLTVNADWQTTGGPIGGLGYDIRVHPTQKDKLYLTDNFAGVLISENSGELWSESNSGILAEGQEGTDVNIFSLTIDPNSPDTIWAGTRSNGSFGVFKSTDSGQSWNRKVNGIDNSHPDNADANLVFRGFTVEPGNSNIVYAQAELKTGEQGRTFEKVYGRVFKSIDGGENWNTIWTGNNLARYLIVDPKDTDVLYLSTGIFDVEAANSNCDGNSISDLGGEGVLKSTDAGVTWVSINAGLEDPYIGTLRMHPDNSQVLYAGGAANDACQNSNIPSVGGLFRTENAGQTWQRLGGSTISGPITAVNFAPSNTNIVYAGFENAIYVSQDSGESWVEYNKDNGKYGPEGINAGIPIDLLVDEKDPETVYINNYGGGVFRSTDGAKTWESWSKGFSGAIIETVAVGDKNAQVYTAGLSGGFRSNHYGDDWEGIANGDASDTFQAVGMAVHPTDNNSILFADRFAGKIHLSTDAGETFSTSVTHSFSNSVEAGFKHISFAPSNPSIVYAALSASSENKAVAGNVVYLSTNGGASFTPLDTGDTFSELAIFDLVVDSSNPSTIYVATSDLTPGDDDHGGALYKSIDGGISFFKVLDNTNVGSVLITRNGVVIVGGLYTGIRTSESATTATSSLGVTWSGPYFSATGSEDYVNDLIQHPSDNTIYMAEKGSGVFSSEDGMVWSEFPSANTPGLTKVAANSLAVTEHVLYVGTKGGGVFRHPLNQQDVVPLDFEFTAVTNAAINTAFTSNEVSISGLSSVASISINNGFYSINGGTFTNAEGWVADGDTIKLQLQSHAEYSTPVEAALTVGSFNTSYIVTTGEASTKAVINDFDGDGVGDVIYRDAESLTWKIHLMNGMLVKSEHASEMSSCCGWLFNGAGDFNNDGMTDVIVRNVTSGKWYIYNLNKGEIISRGYVGIEDAVVVGVQAVADFNNDGFADVLLRNEETGEWTMTLLNNREIIQEYKPAMSKVLGWNIVDAKDYDGNGSDDILIRNSVSGAWYIYLYNGTDIISRGYISEMTNDTNHIIQAVADFDGDGQSDVLLRSSSDFSWTAIFMNGRTPKQTAELTLSKDSSWEFNAADDFDGDGFADITLVNKNTGKVYLYQMNGTTIKSEGELDVTLKSTMEAQTLIRH